MKNKINIANLLRDCPSGMELDCLMYEDVYFDYVVEHNMIHCYIQHETYKTSIIFNQYGTTNSDIKSKCVIFPKGKTTWEGFIPPYKFKDGDVVVAEDEESFQLFLLKHLTRSEDDNNYDGYCYFGWNFQNNELFEKGNWGFNRLATEEEKAKLFQAIKDNGYHWNEETKTLEKLPKFKVGDKVRHKNNHNVVFTISSIEEDSYVCGGKMVFCFNDQDEYELAQNKFDVTTLKTFDKVLVRRNKNNNWRGSFFSHIDDNLHCHCYKYVTIGGKSYPMCIPQEGNEHLCGTTDDCIEYYENW